MTTKLTDEQRAAVESCAGQPVLVTDEATNKIYYLLNEEAFAHLRGLQSARDLECQSKLRELIEEGMHSAEMSAREVFSELRAESKRLAGQDA